MNRSLWILIATIMLLTVGCVHWGTEPLYIKFPDPPKLTFKFCPGEEDKQLLCLSQQDGAALSKWMDKVRAFEAARKRLLDRE